jgi:hypothetical protein
MGARNRSYKSSTDKPFNSVYVTLGQGYQAGPVPAGKYEHLFITDSAFDLANPLHRSPPLLVKNKHLTKSPLKVFYKKRTVWSLRNKKF